MKSPQSVPENAQTSDLRRIRRRLSPELLEVLQMLEAFEKRYGLEHN
jgi:hypothetical protein